MKRYKDFRFPRIRPSDVSFASRLRTVAEQKSGRANPSAILFPGFKWLKLRWHWSQDKRLRSRQ